MNPPNGEVLGFLRPGALFLAVLAGLVASGLVLHFLAVRRFGADRLDAFTRAAEGAVFCVFLGLMIGLAGLQVALRNVFHSGLLWIDPLVRTLVLWVAFLGAMSATSQGRHLHIDVLLRQFRPETGRNVARVLAAAAAVCCAFMANGAFIYLVEESGTGARPFLGIPSWAAQSILLWGFVLLCYRFLVQVLWPNPLHPPTSPTSHP
jgi:TRAP-type C4-dicarboxylate transport system permease small subunit